MRTMRSDNNGDNEVTYAMLTMRSDNKQYCLNGKSCTSDTSMVFDYKYSGKFKCKTSIMMKHVIEHVSPPKTVVKQVKIGVMNSPGAIAMKTKSRCNEMRHDL